MTTLSKLARRGEDLLRAQKAARRLWPEGVPPADAVMDAFRGCSLGEGGPRA